jgi:predicted DNA-binding transcriptional regulator AlpA
MKTMVIREKAPEVREMISINDVLKRILASRSTIERKVRDGTFPKMQSNTAALSIRKIKANCLFY